MAATTERGRERMILSLGPGEPSYVPDGLIGRAQDKADISYLAFLQCYGRELMQWEIICFFSGHQDEWFGLDTVADEMGCEPDVLWGRLAELADTRLLEQRILVTGPMYRLTRSPDLRRLVVRLGSEWRWINSGAARMG